ncbi:PREDICTED: LOW QUALITY PROTEIN: toll-like receptor 2 [Nipponia nippon]|uniref:LOW QUALITY PROTEIN: toll-like receptor 2 n=1 Tax=Nipponia nippon TaxID=128390 RepID=UPI0005118CC9|nr:PREDICTED: LOW QUALITY PROTEIN: toll-like receptor 2 [Nipponia nippon]
MPLPPPPPPPPPPCRGPAPQGCLDAPSSPGPAPATGGTSPATLDADNETGLCKGQDLLRVPHGLPGGLRSLDLSYNKLREITAGDFASMTQLRHLDLGYNNISHIAPDAFLSNLLLEHLRLFNNSLHHIPALALQPLVNLRWLDMSNNLYRSAALGSVFGELRQLQVLSLGGPLLRDISRGDFAVLKDTALQKFAIKSASSLRQYEAGAFSWLNTTELWCDMALDESAAALPVMLQDLRGKPLDYLRFRNLFEFTYYTGDADPFAGLAELQITKLVFYRGKFNENLLRLALLNVQRSRVRDLALVAIDFARSPQWNNSGVGAAAPRLDRLLLQDISNPDVLRFDWTFTWLSGVAALSIINVNFNYVPCDAWGEMRNVEALDISSNRLEDGYIYNQRCHYQGVMPKLESFVLAANQLLRLAVVAALTRTWPRLARLDASHNGLGSLQETCQWSPTLRWLALHHNRVMAGTFGCLPTTLEYLDLSYSQLDRLDMDYFTRSPRLRELRLSGNKIKFIPSEWRCPRLEVLTIDGNSFGVINRGSFVNMPRLISLAAGNNPYHCTCDLYLFLEETQRRGRPILADWPHNWSRPPHRACSPPEPLLDTAVAAYAPRPLECNVLALVAVAVASTAVAVAACAVLCWKLDAGWYLRATYRLVRPKDGRRGATNARQCPYHAFISYSRADADWVRQELLHRLESNTPPYRLCIHERDFTPGRWIIDNIVENIERSAKVIFVLSRSFVDSEWCNYELYFAHQRAVGLGSEDVILVVKEPIDARGLPRRFARLRKMLGSKTYLEWPHEPGRRPFFWLQLRSLLGSPGELGPSTGEEETVVDATT